MVTAFLFKVRLFKLKPAHFGKIPITKEREWQT